jgi:CheY-like chemotaxis protein
VWIQGAAISPGINSSRAGIGRYEELAGLNRTPVIAVTANALTGDREKCMASGMDGYLSKPFTAESLHAVLSQFLRSDDSVAE